MWPTYWKGQGGNHQFGPGAVNGCFVFFLMAETLGWRLLIPRWLLKLISVGSWMDLTCLRIKNDATKVHFHQPITQRFLFPTTWEALCSYLSLASWQRMVGKTQVSGDFSPQKYLYVFVTCQFFFVCLKAGLAGLHGAGFSSITVGWRIPHAKSQLEGLFAVFEGTKTQSEHRRKWPQYAWIWSFVLGSFFTVNALRSPLKRVKWPN